MNYRPVYLDSSALAKLVVVEPESLALTAWLEAWPDQVTSAIVCVELPRILMRGRAAPPIFVRADSVLAGMTILHLDRQVLATAGRLKDPLLRSLDAIHLASALSIGDLPDAFVTYDERLARAAERLKLRVVSPA